MDNNITPLFGSEANDAIEAAEPNFAYTILLKDGSNVEQVGYLVVNALFVAICRGDGVIYWMSPFDAVANVVNNGPVPVGAELN